MRGDRLCQLFPPKNAPSVLPELEERKGVLLLSCDNDFVFDQLVEDTFLNL